MPCFLNPYISTDPRDPWHLSLDISWIFTPQNLAHRACLVVQNVLGVRIRLCVLFPMSSLLPQMPLEVLWVTPTPAMILSKYRPEVGKRGTIYFYFYISCWATILKSKQIASFPWFPAISQQSNCFKVVPVQFQSKKVIHEAWRQVSGELSIHLRSRIHERSGDSGRFPCC